MWTDIDEKSKELCGKFLKIKADKEIDILKILLQEESCLLSISYTLRDIKKNEYWNDWTPWRLMDEIAETLYELKSFGVLESDDNDNNKYFKVYKIADEWQDRLKILFAELDINIF